MSSSALPVDADAGGDGDDDVVSRNGSIKPWFLLGSRNGVLD